MNLEGAISFWTKTLARLSSLASGGALRSGEPAGDKVLKLFQDRTAADVTEYFNGGRDPYGKAWAPLKWRVGKPLILTGALMAGAVNAFRTAAMTRPGHITIQVAGLPRYWRYQNYGTKRIPQRWFMFVKPSTLQSFAEAARDGIGYEIVHHERTTS